MKPALRRDALAPLGGALCVVAVSVIAATVFWTRPVSAARNATAASMSQARTAYLLNCGGCHGPAGRSEAARVPDLGGQVGAFLCSPEGRAYLGRLPNVAFAHLPSDVLAGVLNYVVFSLGAGSAPAGARAFDAQEVARLREAPLQLDDLVAYRAKVLKTVAARCPGASSLSSLSLDSPYAALNGH